MSKFSRDRVKGFLHTDGRRMVNGDGQTVVLRGWGVGNWLNPEGFMIGGPSFFGGADLASFSTPRRYERGRSVDLVIRELCGSAFVEEYQKKWIENYFNETDIKLMAELGYNSVRLPLDSRLFLDEEPGIHWNEENFKVLDRVLDWCEAHKIYAILDRHAAPGGQSALPCDDGVDNRPHTFTEPESRERTMLIWEEIAKRYCDRWIVGGYDLLNEPLSGPGNLYLMPELARFYTEVIERIRKYDKDHMFTLEGAIFSMDLDIFEQDYDPECHNWCIHTHFYGFSPEIRDLYRFLEMSQRCNVPIWIGEGGSDATSNTIFYEIAGAFDMGFALWSWKSAALGGMVQERPLAHRLPAGWEQVQKYCSDGGPRPSYLEAQKIFREMLELIKTENCTLDRISSIYALRQPGITLPAVGFDETEGSFHGNGWRLGNTYCYRTETGMKMVRKPGTLPAQRLIMPSKEPEIRHTLAIDELCLELNENEFVSYTIRDVESEIPLNLTGRTLPCKDCQLTILVQPEGSSSYTKVMTLSASESVSTDINDMQLIQILPTSEAVIRITVEKGTLQLDSIKF